MMDDDRIVADVRRFGWHAVAINDADPPFLYSVGWTRTFDHPEAIIFGLEANTAHGILAAMVAKFRQGMRYDAAGKYDNVLDDVPLGVRIVDESQHELYLGYAMGYCREIRRDLEAIQVFWPDKNDRFPFEPNCELDVYHCQPRLDIPLTRSERKELNMDRWEV